MASKKVINKSLVSDVVLDADDISDTATTKKFTNIADTEKLAGIEALADVTDAANVDAGGDGLIVIYEY